MGKQGRRISIYLQLRPHKQQRSYLPALLRLAHPFRSKQGEASWISSHPEAPASAAPRPSGLEQGGGSGLRPFLWIRDQWGSLKGAWTFLCGSREGGGVCRACWAQDRRCRSWNSVARDPRPRPKGTFLGKPPRTGNRVMHPCRFLLVAPGSAKQGVVTLLARWASVRTSAHIYAATRHVVGEAQSLTSPRALTRHPTGRGYAGCCIPTSEIVLPRSWVNRVLRDPPYTLTGVRRSCSPRVETRHRWRPHRTGSGGRRGRPAPRWGIYVACFRSAVAYPYCGRPAVR